MKHLSKESEYVSASSTLVSGRIAINIGNKQFARTLIIMVIVGFASPYEASWRGVGK